MNMLTKKITKTGQTYWYLNGKRITPSEAAYYRHREGYEVVTA